MMSAMTQDKVATWKRSGVRMLVGALVGAGAMSAVVAAAGSDLLDAMGPSRVALGAVGLVYGLMAALVGFGLAAPRATAPPPRTRPRPSRSAPTAPCSTQRTPTTRSR